MALELDVQPGIISAIIFVFLDIFTVGFLDLVLAKVVCHSYYRDFIDEGKPVSVKSADIPGLSYYLLGEWKSRINMFALSVKLALLGVVLAANISINSEATPAVPTARSATFLFNPDYVRDHSNFNMVVRRPESSKSCYQELKRENNTELLYYPISFNLQNQHLLETGDATSDQESQGKYDVDDSTILCMSPEFVRNKVEPLATVLGCTHEDDDKCLTITSTDDFVDPQDRSYEFGDVYEGVLTHFFIKYSDDDVQSMFKERHDGKRLQLTCLRTEIGIVSSQETNNYTQCLLVAKDDQKLTTTVQRWVLAPINSTTSNSTQMFLQEYPGPVFKGIVDISRDAAARYLDLPFPNSDYRTLSGTLVAQGATYQYLPMEIQELQRGATVTTMGWWAVALVAISVSIVFVSYLISILYFWNDKRPRFNTINGLADIVQAEHEKRGLGDDDSVQGVLVGLHFTNADSMRFGPLNSESESIPYREGYGINLNN